MIWYILCSILIIIISLIICYIGVSALNDAKKLKIENQKEQQKLDTQIKEQYLEIEELSNKRANLIDNITKEKEKIDNLYENEKNKVTEQLEEYKQRIKDAGEVYVESLERAYSEYEQSYSIKIQALADEEENISKELQKLKNSLSAGIEAQLREKEKEEQLDFYTLQLDERAKKEVSAIKQIEYILSDPRPLRMLIWTTYYSKKANELCARVLGNKKITGIYRITNMETKQCYIGQAKDIKERWREHMKCGLGIDTPAGNKLYKAMLDYGLDVFTFELIEECSSDNLNEKERFFIDLYQSYDFGMNSNRGNK